MLRSLWKPVHLSLSPQHGPFVTVSSCLSKREGSDGVFFLQKRFRRKRPWDYESEKPDMQAVMDKWEDVRFVIRHPDELLRLKHKHLVTVVRQAIRNIQKSHDLWEFWKIIAMRATYVLDGCTPSELTALLSSFTILIDFQEGTGPSRRRYADRRGNIEERRLAVVAAEEVSKRAAAFTLSQLSACLLGVGRLDIKSSAQILVRASDALTSLLEETARQIPGKLVECTPTTATRMLQAYAELRVVDEGIFPLLLDLVVVNRGEFSGEQIVSCLESLATLEIPERRVLDALSAMLSREEILHKLPVGDLTAAQRCLVSLGVQSPSLSAAVSRTLVLASTPGLVSRREAIESGGGQKRRREAIGPGRQNFASRRGPMTVRRPFDLRDPQSLLPPIAASSVGLGDPPEESKGPFGEKGRGANLSDLEVRVAAATGEILLDGEQQVARERGAVSGLRSELSLWMGTGGEGTGDTPLLPAPEGSSEEPLSIHFDLSPQSEVPFTCIERAPLTVPSSAPPPFSTDIAPVELTPAAWRERFVSVALEGRESRGMSYLMKGLRGEEKGEEKGLMIQAETNSETSAQTTSSSVSLSLEEPSKAPCTDEQTDLQALNAQTGGNPLMLLCDDEVALEWTERRGDLEDFSLKSACLHLEFLAVSEGLSRSSVLPLMPFMLPHLRRVASRSVPLLLFALASCQLHSFALWRPFVLSKARQKGGIRRAKKGLDADESVLQRALHKMRDPGLLLSLGACAAHGRCVRSSLELVVVGSEKFFSGGEEVEEGGERDRCVETLVDVACASSHLPALADCCLYSAAARAHLWDLQEISDVLGFLSEMMETKRGVEILRTRLKQSVDRGADRGEAESKARISALRKMFRAEDTRVAAGGGEEAVASARRQAVSVLCSHAERLLDGRRRRSGLQDHGERAREAAEERGSLEDGRYCEEEKSGAVGFFEEEVKASVERLQSSIFWLPVASGDDEQLSGVLSDLSVCLPESTHTSSGKSEARLSESLAEWAREHALWSVEDGDESQRGGTGGESQRQEIERINSSSTKGSKESGEEDWKHPRYSAQSE
uniref:Uncharacterized protein n=1 Tax=Chromera velia CCMP2878 TaxID=1169474 RepID=A0A0G4I1Y3_9ALVE|eukprot:Cvel_10260.t1-p1 / transcript=Cvel_10260.t1 / gene=Cvel_10260 / organism=Chromera_velia_CCMP2878 / gene_product=hypothetical protein / transcript_product=hypothetical protein / location=Cvel_scaffold615:27056-32601(+) / protein_length=1064 / sequence_SO=supercontig / SO=protein_coding / is_pseudo=false